MNYQYNQTPPPPPQQAPFYVNAEEEKRRKKEGFERFADKMAEFCGGNKLLAALISFSDILSYIVTGFCVVMSIVLLSMSSYSSVLCVAAILVGVLPIAKKNILPLAIALSGAALADVITVCFTFGRIVSLIGITELMWASSYASLIIGCVFKIIFILAELAVLVLPIIMSWQYFAATLPPKAPRPAPMYNGQMPQQNYQQPPVQNYQQSVQSYQQPPVQSYQQVPPPPQPQTTADKQCPNCGQPNVPDAAFCHGCGTKLG